MKGMGNMMKQAQKLQAKMLRMQEELGERTVESSVGGGMVKVVANGKQEVLSLEIDPEVVDPEDIEMLQDLVLSANPDAHRVAGLGYGGSRELRSLAPQGRRQEKHAPEA